MPGPAGVRWQHHVSRTGVGIDVLSVPGRKSGRWASRDTDASWSRLRYSIRLFDWGRGGNILYQRRPYLPVYLAGAGAGKDLGGHKVIVPVISEAGRLQSSEAVSGGEYKSSRCALVGDGVDGAFAVS